MSKVLLIVDIQYQFGKHFTWSYLNTVYKRIIKDYDSIFMIMEPNIDVIRKNNRIVDMKFKPDAVPTFIVNSLTMPPYYKLYEPDYWNFIATQLGDDKPSIVHLDNKYHPFLSEQYPMYINNRLQCLLEILDRNCYDRIDIIGGGLTKCVSLTSRLLMKVGLVNNHTINSDCYHIHHFSYNDRLKNVFNTNPIKSLNSKLLTNGILEMTTIPVLDNTLDYNINKKDII